MLTEELKEMTADVHRAAEKKLISVLKKTTTTADYMHGYGTETQKMWLSFKEFLNRPFPLMQRREIIAAAEDTFITFKNWIDKHELQPRL